MNMPVPATHQAIRAPKGPVASPKVRGREKIPAPTMEPTTRAIRVPSENWFVVVNGTSREFRQKDWILPTCAEPIALAIAKRYGYTKHRGGLLDAARSWLAWLRP